MNQQDALFSITLLQ